MQLLNFMFLISVMKPTANVNWRSASWNHSSKNKHTCSHYGRKRSTTRQKTGLKTWIIFLIIQFLAMPPPDARSRITKVIRVRSLFILTSQKIVITPVMSSLAITFTSLTWNVPDWLAKQLKWKITALLSDSRFSFWFCALLSRLLSCFANVEISSTKYAVLWDVLTIGLWILLLEKLTTRPKKRSKKKKKNCLKMKRPLAALSLRFWEMTSTAFRSEDHGQIDPTTCTTKSLSLVNYYKMNNAFQYFTYCNKIAIL